MKYIYDYSKLKGRITEKAGNRKNLCAMFPMAHSTLWNRLNNKAYFTQSEIERMCEILEISDKDIKEYFFSKQSSENRNATA
ncbi:MAG: DUF739 family protein [Fusobacteriaceae bacterium]|jgi:DNA-binding Xre family transcriptional regulator|nr:DUF739 family protein [Fusobacteriaceae bacterium]